MNAKKRDVAAARQHRMEKALAFLELNKLWREIIRLRDRGRCRRCGKPGSECAHIIAGRRPSLVWNPDNGVLLCWRCHDWGHDQPLLWKVWARETIGDLIMERLRQINLKPPRMDLVELKDALVMVRDHLAG